VRARNHGIHLHIERSQRAPHVPALLDAFFIEPPLLVLLRRYQPFAGIRVTQK